MNETAFKRMKDLPSTHLLGSGTVEQGRPAGMLAVITGRVGLDAESVGVVLGDAGQAMLGGDGVSAAESLGDDVLHDRHIHLVSERNRDSGKTFPVDAELTVDASNAHRRIVGVAVRASCDSEAKTKHEPKPTRGRMESFHVGPPHRLAAPTCAPARHLGP